MSRAQPPPPGFLAGCTLSSWLDLTQAGPTAWLLIGHSRPRRARETAASIEAGPQALADSMGLRPATSRIPRVSARLRIRALTVALDYGHDDYLLRVPDTKPEWRQHVAGDGAAVLAVGLDPLSIHGTPEVVDAYFRERTGGQRVLLGATSATEQ